MLFRVIQSSFSDSGKSIFVSMFFFWYQYFSTWLKARKFLVPKCRAPGDPGQVFWYLVVNNEIPNAAYKGMAARYRRDDL